jgi:hypothetical protein
MHRLYIFSFIILLVTKINFSYGQTYTVKMKGFFTIYFQKPAYLKSAAVLKSLKFSHTDLILRNPKIL